MERLTSKSLFVYCCELMSLRRDIPKIIKFKATNSLRVSCLFCIFKHSPKKNGLTAKAGVIKNKNTW